MGRLRQPDPRMEKGRLPVKFLRKAKDGGPKSTVTGYWLVEFKRLFSLALLKFEDGSRDEFHSHAFNSLNWVLRGRVREEMIDGTVNEFTPSPWPIATMRDTFHRVVSDGTTWVLTVRGPWAEHWLEYNPITRVQTVLAYGRKVVDSWSMGG